MDPRFAQFPRALAERALTTRLAGDIPALLAHPEPGWHESGSAPTPVPVMLWFHGRSVNKELDPGRYLRWVRAGFAACAIDLPGHGERELPGFGESDHTLKVVEQAAGEVDTILGELGDARFNGAFDTSRPGIGGMSAGGMVTLVRLCRPHTFVCAAVESTAGDFAPMAGTAFAQEPMFTDLNPREHLGGWRPIPLLALHSEKDEWVPIRAIRGFIEELRTLYSAQGVDPGLIELTTWAETGAYAEHAGFGKVATEAKNLQVGFLERHLLSEG